MRRIIDFGFIFVRLNFLVVYFKMIFSDFIIENLKEWDIIMFENFVV